jgi:N-acetyl-gamma-glutamylphosphate reductase
MARVSLFGATGGTGLEILTRLLSRPEVSEVRCVVRSPEKLPEDGDPLQIKRGNYLVTTW